MPISLNNSIPAELTNQGQIDPNQTKPLGYKDGTKPSDSELASYVSTWRNKLRQERTEKVNIWTDCWKLYRGVEDFSDKEDWQAKLVLPKAFSSVKQATNIIQRLLNTAKEPWNLEPYDNDDDVEVLKADKMTELTRAFLERGKYTQHFIEGLECGFITGVGVWKVWWGLVPRTRVRVQTVNVPTGGDPTSPLTPQMDNGVVGGVPTQPPPDMKAAQPLGQGAFDVQRQNDQLYPNQLPNEATLPFPGQYAPEQQQPSFSSQKQIIREEVLEGQLFVRAVDPYNFYWLPGSKFNAWTGTIEEMEIPQWELMGLAEQGVFDGDVPGSGLEKVKKIQPSKIDEAYKQSYLRFTERVSPQTGPSKDVGIVRLMEYYGPIICNGQTVTKYGHMLIANDTVVLIAQENPLWNHRAPYVAYSPLKLPFRVDGVGIIEQIREVDRNLSKIANLSVDTLMYRLMPLFEVNMDAFENPEDFETGLNPGKMFRRNRAFTGQQGITPIAFQDISGGAVQTSAELDRAHQEGAFVSEIQQGIPRFRGLQSATEVSTKEENQTSFFGSMAQQIEQDALLPIIDLATDLIFQFIDTANDPRIAGILGVDKDIIAGISREELMEMIQGDYEIKVTGITGQLQKAEMLQNLVQVMNIIGQNPESWLPYLNQDELLRRILEAFRPAIHDIEKIIATPGMVAARKTSTQSEQMTPEMLKMIPILAEQAHKVQMEKDAQTAAQQKQQFEQQMAGAQLGLEIAKTEHEHATAEKELAIAKQTASNKSTSKGTK